jgi:ribosomal protein L21E
MIKYCGRRPNNQILLANELLHQSTDLEKILHIYKRGELVHVEIHSFKKKKKKKDFSFSNINTNLRIVVTPIEP